MAKSGKHLPGGARLFPDPPLPIAGSQLRLAYTALRLRANAGLTDSKISFAKTTALLFRAKELLKKSEELFIKTEELLIKTEELFIKTKELLIKTEELLSKEEELLIKKEELLIKTEELLINSKELLINSKENRSNSRVFGVNLPENGQKRQDFGVFKAEGRLLGRVSLYAARFRFQILCATRRSA